MNYQSSSNLNHEFNTFPGSPDDLLWLTNSNGDYDYEPLEELESVFQKLKIPHGIDTEGYFFPLTSEEKDLIAPEILYVDFEGDLSLEMGASVLFKNSKYLAHEAFIEFQANDQRATDWAENLNREVARRLTKVSDRTGGYLIWSDKPEHHGGNRVFKPTLLIPFAYAKSVAGRDYKRWKDHLGRLLDETAN